MEHLLEDLLQRWEQAFDELKTLPQYQNQIETTQYANGRRYSLGKFDWISFPSCGNMTPIKDEVHPISLHEYGFNRNGLPCYVKFGHSYNKIDWAGFYIYTDHLVEHVEFCLNTGIPSTLERIKYENGKKIAFQRLNINSGGSVNYGSSRGEIINTIRTGKYDLIAKVSQFHYDKSDKIEKAFNLQTFPGLKKARSHDEYRYAPDGILQTITRYFELGGSRMIYTRPAENTTPQSLIQELALAMAQEIVSTITAQRDQDAPIALLELSYHYADSYLPFLSTQTAQEQDDALDINDNIFHLFPYAHLLQPSKISFENLFVQLEQMMQEEADANLGRIMLRKTATILTQTKLFGKIATTDDFAAYAIDWSIEGHDQDQLENILSECGVGSEQLKAWHEKGMFSSSSS